MVRNKQVQRFTPEQRYSSLLKPLKGVSITKNLMNMFTRDGFRVII